LDLSYGSRVDRISIFPKNASYFSLFFIAASLTILLKHSLSKTNNSQVYSAFIEAALGALYSNANSPNDSPGT